MYPISNNKSIFIWGAIYHPIGGPVHFFGALGHPTALDTSNLIKVHDFVGGAILQEGINTTEQHTNNRTN